MSTPVWHAPDRAAPRSRTAVSALWRRCLGVLVPQSLFGRLALLLMVAVISSHVLALTLVFELMPRPLGPPPVMLPVPVAGVADMAMPPSPNGSPPWAQAGHPPPPPGLQMGLLLDIGIRLGALMLAAWVGARWLSQPIRSLAGAAQELGHNIYRAPLPEQGPKECVEATRVFNHMQLRICEQLAQRDQFVAAVSHDLRTPLTRLALRAQGLRSSQERERFGQDIAEMDDMIRTTLDYLRGAADAEARVLLDMDSLVRSIAHDCQDCGQDVQLLPSVSVTPMRVQPSAMRRCISNVVENAVRYGQRARIGMEEQSGVLRITVRDDGPGIPETEQERVLAPFYRLEGSRNRNSGGVGLGLATTHDVARRHGGTIVLRNHPDGGLAACITLPYTAAP
ncbi:HAMP domain-containing protein [Rhodoferax aquaticus]|uniref:histidine kinase n=2 Tax=Rhodoferax aquaticus TaxID=2527691 RepID=A0A515EW78_9BURK|nr:HAMP domain-containing protein [Rhodoferax aquaticus]